MIQKILIANRGEIACRIIRTCHRLNIATVVVYHEEDAQSLAVQQADEAVLITGATPVAAYLDGEQIIAAAKTVQANAIHPGFGFLSENAAFAKACRDEGVEFIGPSDRSIALMGDKIASKRLAKEAGVNTIPGFDGEIADENHAVSLANQIGYPVILKASSGGGGKGMRIAQNDEMCRSAFAQTTSEAIAAFGDGRLLIEKYIEEPRHIEIQVLGDQMGHLVHLGERECSIQRRHQKIIEEAPSSFLRPETREQMAAQALSLAKAVDYYSAGTVEFVVDAQQNFYFLEMNTRIQVEHPVTEMITGIDLVAKQIDVANREPLNLNQSDIHFKGHAIECRFCAEDAHHDFMPAIGQLRVFKTPHYDGLRIDSGIVQGSVIGASFDSMLAKLIVYAPTRNQAIDLMIKSLQETVALGVTTNAQYLVNVLTHPQFVAGQIHTHFLSQYADVLTHHSPSANQTAVILAAALLSNRTVFDRRYTPPLIHSQMGCFAAQLGQPIEQPNVGFSVWVDGKLHHVSLLRVRMQDASLSHISLMIDHQGFHLNCQRQLDGSVTVALLSEYFQTITTQHGDTAYVHAFGASHEILVFDPVNLAKTPIKEGDQYLAPMPGTVVEVKVQEGQAISNGQLLLIIESMKMQIYIEAKRDGVVAKLPFAKGQTFSKDDVLASLVEEKESQHA